MKLKDVDAFTVEILVVLILAVLVAGISIAAFEEQADVGVSTDNKEVTYETIKDTDRGQSPASDSGGVRSVGSDTDAPDPYVIPDSVWELLEHNGGECYMTLVVEHHVMDTDRPNPLRIPLGWCRAAYGIITQPS